MSVASEQAARDHAVRCARDVMAGDIQEGSISFDDRIEVTDEEGRVLFHVTFRSAVEIIG